MVAILTNVSNRSSYLGGVFEYEILVTQAIINNTLIIIGFVFWGVLLIKKNIIFAINKAVKNQYNPPNNVIFSRKERYVSWE